MRILAWMYACYPTVGGIQTAARHLMPALYERGHEVAVVASHYGEGMPDKVMLDGVPIHRFDFHHALVKRDMPKMVYEGRRVTKFIQDFAPDIVHIMGHCASAFFFFKARQHFPVPYIFTSHTEDAAKLHDGQQEATLLRQLLNEAAWVTTVTELETRRLAAAMPAIAMKLSCVYQGMAMPNTPPLAPPTAPRLLCIGRVELEKNFALALRAFAHVLPAFPDARLTIAGDGLQLPRLKELSHELGIATQVDFLGWVQPKQVPQLINEASAVVLSSSQEGLPLVGVEAAQMARPLLAPEISGIPELVTDGETGLLVPPNDVAALAGAMRQILRDPMRAAQMGAAAQARVNEKFSQAGMADNFCAIYDRVVMPA